MLELIGKIEFDPVNVTKKHNKQASWKKTAMVKFDCDIWEYYSWFLKKRFNLYLNKPLRGTHLTIINDKFDPETEYLYDQGRQLFHGKEIRIKYDPTLIRANDKGHWWINAQSDDAKNIRSVMGLTPDPYFGFHITIGLATHLQLDHSKYILKQCLKYNL
jgi:hypothetical protein